MDADTATYVCDGKEGSLKFNGHYYVEDGPPSEEDVSPRRWSHHLPLKLEMFISTYETEPYEVVKEDGRTKYHHKKLEELWYTIEVYRREKHESTSVYGPVNLAADGEEEDIMNVCFTPTCWQTIYFRVVEIH